MRRRDVEPAPGVATLVKVRRCQTAAAGAPLVSSVSPCNGVRQSGTPRAGITSIVLLASARDRLPESRQFVECGVISGAVRARSVHKTRHGHNRDWAAV